MLCYAEGKERQIVWEVDLTCTLEAYFEDVAGIDVLSPLATACLDRSHAILELCERRALRVPTTWNGAGAAHIHKHWVTKRLSQQNYIVTTQNLTARIECLNQCFMCLLTTCHS